MTIPKLKLHIFLMIIVIALLKLLSVYPVQAGMIPHTEIKAWNPDGIFLQTIKHGSVNGGIYVGGGHGMEYTTRYIQNFTVPNGTVKWARLYVSAKDTLWLNVSLNQHLLGNYTNLASNPKVYSNYKTDDGGMYWAYYDNAADYIKNGSNTAIAHFGSRIGLNTKSWGIVLLAVYENGDSPELIEYWINEGNPLLHGTHPPFATYRNTTNTSIGPVDTAEVTDATLWTVYIWGSEESETDPHDTLWFNTDMIAMDASDGAGNDDQGNSWRGACFDLEKWDVTHSLDRYNMVLYDRGGDDLLCPVGAVLMTKRVNRAVHLTAHILPAVSLKVVPETVDFGILAPGQQSNEHILTLINTGTCTITATADVTDTAIDLFTEGLLLDSDDWKAYSKSMAIDAAVDVGTVLDVPEDYTGVGIKEGGIIFWAEMV